MVQILHTSGTHWITLSTIGCHEGQVQLYDSMIGELCEPEMHVQMQIASLICASVKQISCMYQVCH